MWMPSLFIHFITFTSLFFTDKFWKDGSEKHYSDSNGGEGKMIKLFNKFDIEERFNKIMALIVLNFGKVWHLRAGVWQGTKRPSRAERYQKKKSHILEVVTFPHSYFLHLFLIFLSEFVNFQICQVGAAKSKKWYIKHNRPEKKKNPPEKKNNPPKKEEPSQKEEEEERNNSVAQI